MSKQTKSLSTQTAIGVLWSGGGQAVTQITHLVVRLILARLLLPEDFGLVAIAMVVLSFTNWFLDMGFGAALVQRKVLTEEHRSTAFWTNVIMGVTVALIVVVCAQPIAEFFDNDNLVPILMVLSLDLILNAPIATLNSLFVRELDFQIVAARKLVGTLLGGVVGIVMALSGFGVWALVGNALVASFSALCLLLKHSSWYPSFTFSIPAFRELWAFSRPLVGARLFNYFSRNFDTILIGRFLGVSALGYYNLGYQFVLMPLIYVTRPINSVLFASFSKIQDEPKRMQNAYLRTVQAIALITFPAMTVIAVASPPIVPLLLGEKWLPATQIIPFLAIAGMLQSIQNLMPSVLQSTGNTSLVFRWTLILLGSNVLAFLIGIRAGILGVAVCYAIANLIVFPILQTNLLKVLQISWGTFLKNLYSPCLSTFALLITWQLCEWIISHSVYQPSLIFSITIQIVSAGVIYLAASWASNPVIRHAVQRLRFSRELNVGALFK